MKNHNPAYDKMENEQLLGAFSTNRNAVLEELYKRYSTKTYGLCIKYLGDREKAKDAVSDIFMRLRRDLEKHEIKQFNAWFYMYAKNHCLGELRKAKTAAKHQEIYQKEKTDVFAPHQFADEDLNRLESGLDTLKNNQRECLRLFYYQKQSYTEIAGVLSISEKKVKSHLQNGKRNLRLFLESFNQNTDQKRNG
ncbi:sigma-70 family RNA polymerase sigma factor [Cryomorpha ignava]|uniref:Sigma-70 family RNA polymerase sigma factor n=1 Tax=Cryomorpha ignava TaxID=101383 RepID=A0A7K3WJX8_9FLAO|nr:sigma-70 family RNA polymerase sigma factor [Cryomorpha ignava]NEN21950.1 sigma-70 family RNA polymerase sigma factor [Cryomorpha ignava]